MEKMRKGGGIEDSNVRGNLGTAVGFLEKENEMCGIKDHHGEHDEKPMMKEKSKMKEKE